MTTLYKEMMERAIEEYGQAARFHASMAKVCKLAGDTKREEAALHEGTKAQQICDLLKAELEANPDN